MGLLEELDALTGKDLWTRFHALCRDFAGTQKATLAEILGHVESSRFGRAHGLSAGMTLDEYRRAVPLQDWSDIAPHADAIAAGEQGVLSCLPVERFLKTSGSTGKPKLVPDNALTRATRRNIMAVYSVALMRDHQRASSGKVFPVVAATRGEKTATGIPIEFASGANLASMAGPVLARLAFPDVLIRVADPESARYAMMRFAVEQPVTFAAGNNPLQLVQRFQTAEERRDEILEDIASGTVSRKADLPPEVRQALEPHLRPNPVRARELEAAAGRSQRFTPAEYWPELDLVCCWLGGSMAPFVPEARGFLPPGAAFRDFGYGSSEGRFTIPVVDEKPEGIVVPHTIFYEFLAVDGEGGKQPLLGHELEVGAQYELVLTTHAGLCRYRIHDVVRVEGCFEGAPVVAFVRKLGDVGNIMGEKLAAELVEAAVREEGRREGGLRPRHVVLVPRPGERRYLVLVEPGQGGASPAEWRAWLAGLDARLQELGVSYRNRRSPDLLHPPCLGLMRAGWRDRLLASRAGPEGPGSQVKLPVFMATVELPEMLEELVDFRGDSGEPRAREGA